ncbi:MAG: Nif3-like dinuclear metal center hexameric protein [Candidatus Lokiarchaeota archaeon]|nr:Nif3-like dinuclear metal center hexameric protein [Candidatus Lokiarchaeota archaeon]
MLIQEITAILTNKLSPKAFKINSETYGLYYDKNWNNKIIKKGMLTIDLTLEAIHYALKQKVNLIISYHSLINKPIKKFNQNIINKLALLSRYPVSIFVLNSTFISAEEGISDTIANALYLKIDSTFEIKNKNGIKIPIGRICSPINYLNKKQSFILENLINRIKTNLNLPYVSYVGDLKKSIKKICIIGGYISKTNYIKKAMNIGCDCYISGKINYFDAIFARDIGLNLIETSHYQNVILAMKKLCNILSLEFPEVEFFLFESMNPIKTYI